MAVNIIVYKWRYILCCLKAWLQQSFCLSKPLITSNWVGAPPVRPLSHPLRLLLAEDRTISWPMPINMLDPNICAFAARVFHGFAAWRAATTCLPPCLPQGLPALHHNNAFSNSAKLPISIFHAGSLRTSF